MAATVFPAPSSGNLPPLATEKIFETFSNDGFLNYRPTGGLPAGRYAVEARGVDVDYLDITAPGFAYQGKGNIAYFDVPTSGGEIQASACTFGDPGFLATTRNFPLPNFVFDSETEGTYSWNPGNNIAYHSATGSWIGFGNTSSNLRVACSVNGSSWTLFGSGLTNGGWTHLGDTTFRTIIADVAYMKGNLYATSYHPDGGNMYRTSDLTGRSGWSIVLSGSGGFNLFESPNPSSNRIFRSAQGQIAYSDNNGSTWTTVTVGTGVDTGNGLYSPVFKGNDIYIISSGRYYSGSQTSKIFRSTDDGASWTQVHNFGSLIPLSMAYSPTLDRFVVIISDDSSAPRGTRARISTDNCSTFTNGFTFANESTSWLNPSIIWHNDRFVAAYSTSNGSGPTMLGTSTDGTSFTNVRGYGGRITSLISTPLGVMYRLAGTSAHGVFRTSDFTTFIEPQSNFTSPNGIAFANGNYVVTNNTTSYLFGPTLDNLELRTNAPVSISFVVGGNGVFMARDNASARPVVSSDGSTWTAQTANTLAGLPCFTGGFFIRQDSSRNVFTSIDAVNWTFRAQLPHVMDRFSKVKDIYVAFGSVLTGGVTDRFYTSRDLINWDSTNTGTNQNVWSIGYSETEKIYVGQFRSSTNLIASSSINMADSNNGGFSTGLSQGRGTNSIGITAGQISRVENIAGLIIGKTGYLVADGSGSATDITGYRLFYAWPNNQSAFVMPDSVSGEQPSRANGELAVINSGGTGIVRTKYGKAAVFAVYRVRT